MNRRLLSAILAATFVAGSAAIPAATVAVPRPDAPAAEAYQPDSVECAVLKKINAFRKKAGAPSLRLSQPLGDAARHHSEDMAERNYFSHDLKGGTTWEENIRDFGYSGDPVGENIAAGQESAAEVFDAWRTSKGHRKNMLDGDFRAIGIARAYDRNAKYGWYWTTTFGGDVEREVSCR